MIRLPETWRPEFRVAAFRDPDKEHEFRDKSLEAEVRAVRELNAVMMPFVQFSEQAILAGIFGNLCGAVRTAISAAATAQTAIATGSWATAGVSGNMDQTPNTTAIINVMHQGTGATQNQYTNPHAFALTGSSATSLTIASQSVGPAIAVGDAIFLDGSASAGGSLIGGPSALINTWYLGLSTATYTASQATILAGEPSSTGSYARIVLTNNQANFPLPTAASPSVLTSGAAFTFVASTAAWSSGATNLACAFLADASTLDGGNIYAVGALGTPQSVNAAGVTLSFASNAITISLS